MLTNLSLLPAAALRSLASSLRAGGHRLALPGERGHYLHVVAGGQQICVLATMAPPLTGAEKRALANSVRFGLVRVA